MGENSAIAWTKHTFNPWVGCTKVSEACDNCYAESWAKRAGTPELWEGSRRRTSPANWSKVLRWNDAARLAGERHRVFCASLADVFDNQVPDEWRDDLWRLISNTPDLDWLLLTKRPQNIKKMLPGALRLESEFTPTVWARWPWPNVWLGTTCENQKQYQLRYVKHLSKIPAAVRFVSYEPALGPVLLLQDSPDILPHWVIFGGESGAEDKVRPCRPDWARSMRDQCARIGIPFFMKQWGTYQSNPIRPIAKARALDPDAKGGMLLDGEIIQQFPRSRAVA